MKQPLLFILGLFSFSTLNAQQWCAPGAEWLYGFESQQANGVRHARYTGDTIIGGLAAKRIEQAVYAYEPVLPFGDPFTFVAPTLYTAEVGDMIMLWDNGSSTYDTLLWFGALPGQHWDVAHFAGPGRFDVLDTGTSVVDGVPLRYLIVEEPIVMGYVDTLRQRIGFNFYYVNPMESLILDFTTSWIQCYRDNDIAEFHGPNQHFACDFTLAVEEKRSTDVRLSPNPGTDHFTLELAPGAHTVTVFDALGTRVSKHRTNDTRTDINTELLSAGVYFVRIDQDASVMRWVKN